MRHIITKEAYNVLNARLPDMVLSGDISDDKIKWRFAHYFERSWAPVEFHSWQDAFDIVKGYCDGELLVDSMTGCLWIKDSTIPEIYKSAFAILDLDKKESSNE